MSYEAPAPQPTICHVLHSLQVGGGEVLARSFALRNSAEFRPVFALLDDVGTLGEELRQQGYTVHLLGRRPGFDIHCVRRLARFVRSEFVSLIHAHQYAPLFYSCLARFPQRKVPILFTEHGRDYPDYRRWKRVWANRVLVTTKDRFIAVGQHVREALIQFEGLPSERVEVIYNGRDLRSFAPNHAVRDDVRGKLGLPDDMFVIVQVARLNRLKDYPTALRVIDRMKTMVPHSVLLIVGDGEERTAVEARVRELGLASSVRFLGERNDVGRLLQAADVFLLSSISEGTPLTLIEAMASALPCVATRVGGVPEIVKHEETGLLADSGNDRELAQHVARLASDPVLRERFGRAARARAVSKFDELAMHDRYRRLYREMISRRPDELHISQQTNERQAAANRV